MDTAALALMKGPATAHSQYRHLPASGVFDTKLEPEIYFQCAIGDCFGPQSTATSGSVAKAGANGNLFEHKYETGCPG